MPRSPAQAKGLLLSSIFEHNDPVVFMEPKILYRAAVEHVPNEYYTIPLSKAEVIKPGNDLTIISYGQPLYLCSAAISAIEKTMKGVNVELIDLRTIYPWDRQTVLDSVRKTGRAVVVHESMINYGVGAEVAATLQEGAFLRLEAPVKRVAGWSTHTGLDYEQFILPDVASKLISGRVCLELSLIDAFFNQEFTMPSNKLWNIDREAYRAMTIDETETIHICSQCSLAMACACHCLQILIDRQYPKYSAFQEMSQSL